MDAPTRIKFFAVWLMSITLQDLSAGVKHHEQLDNLNLGSRVLGANILEPSAEDDDQRNERNEEGEQDENHKNCHTLSIQSGSPRVKGRNQQVR